MTYMEATVSENVQWYPTKRSLKARRRISMTKMFLDGKNVKQIADIYGLTDKAVYKIINVKDLKLKLILEKVEKKEPDLYVKLHRRERVKEVQEKATKDY